MLVKTHLSEKGHKEAQPYYYKHGKLICRIIVNLEMEGTSGKFTEAFKARTYAEMSSIFADIYAT